MSFKSGVESRRERERERVSRSLTQYVAVSTEGWVIKWHVKVKLYVRCLTFFVKIQNMTFYVCFELLHSHSESWEFNYNDQWAKYMNSFWRFDD